MIQMLSEIIEAGGFPLVSATARDVRVDCICPNGPIPYEQNFDLDKSRQKFHHSFKEHHKLSNIPKFCCEML